MSTISFGSKMFTQALMVTAWIVIFGTAVAPAASAHESGYSSVGKTPPGSYPALNWYDNQTSYVDLLNIAKLKWNAFDRVVISNTILSSKRDVTVYDIDNKYLENIGLYTHRPSQDHDYIRLNRGWMDWEGGDFNTPGHYHNHPASRESARTLVVVHEFGHAVGLAHHCDPSASCTSVETVMVSGATMWETQDYTPSSTDRDEFYDIWP